MKKPKKSLSEGDSSQKPEDENFLIVGIGASAGGIQALKEFFENVPADSDSAYVVILHLSPDHDSQLASVLQSVARIPVTQVKEKVKVVPNHVYVVPPNQHLGMFDGHINVEPNLSIEERRAPVDIFFRTLAESHDSRAVAVILSGTGANGSMGIKRVKEKGGVAFVQNPREAEFSEMPRNSIATDLIDQVLNASEIPAKIIAYKNNLGVVEIPVEPESRPEDDQAALREIFTVLRVRTGHDFSNYKRATVLRRIERRITVRELGSLSAYAAFIKDNPNEAQSLLKDLLISVTNFFRDRKAFEFLEMDVIPRILHDKSASDQVRVWVAGCATGEEAYSLAMILAEQVENLSVPPSIQIFATDIDEAAIAASRDGFYTINDAADVSPERLRRYFTRDGEGFRIRRELREMVLFANHNLLKDPPFSHLDLVTCRNLLIYLNSTAQERAMETFHFALNPGSFLFLGTSESIDGAGDLYAPISKEHHVYQSRQATARGAYPVPDAPPAMRYVEPQSIAAATAATMIISQERENRLLERISFGDLHQQMLEQYAPPSIVVNENYDIVHLSSRAGRFLQIAGGEPSKNLLYLIRPELRLELRTALFQAVKQRTNVEAPNLQIGINGRTEFINIHVRPVLRNEDTARGFLLVIFEPSSKDAAAANQPEKIIASDEPLARRLEEELERTKTQLRTTVEQYEIQTEELRASNEELQAMNEELRSTAEELETSREELQSVNEELMTVNQELKIKIEELSQSNNDFQNLLNSTEIGTIFLDSSLRVKMFTPSVREVFNLIDADLNRPLADITTKLDFNNLQADVERVLETLQTIEREIETDKGNWFLMRIFPYRTSEDRISGTVITFFNITNRKQIEQDLHKLVQSREQQTRIFDTTLSSIADFAYTFDREGRFIYANKPLLDLLGVTLEEITGKTFRELPYPKDLADKFMRQIEQVFETRKPITDETPFTNPEGKEGFYEYIFTPVTGEDGAVEVVAGSTRVITERRAAENSIRFQAKLLNTVEQSVIATDLDGKIIFWNDFAEKLYGWTAQAATGRYVREMTPPEMAEKGDEIMFQLRQGKSWSGEFTVQRRDGTKFPAQVFNSPIEDENGNLIGIVGVSVEITERKRAELALAKSEESLRLLLESASDYAIFSVTKDNLVETWNKGAEMIFGWKEKEIVGRDGAILFTPEDRANKVPENEIQFAAEKGKAEDERWHMRKDGTKFFASGVMQPLRDGGIHGFVKICRDQTEKIEAEKAVRDKETLQKLVAGQEDERRRIARDIHDHFGQRLTALRLKLETIRKICDGSEELCNGIEEAQEVAGQLDADVDFIAWELRPAALDDLGLPITLKNFVREWSRHTNVRADYHTSGFGKRRLSYEVETNLYRIAQEALNNIYKHAKAETVSVLLEKRKNTIVLIIEDDGVGFNVESKKTRSKGLGLSGMNERAKILGGEVEIESAPKQGTTIFARVPIAVKQKNG